MRLKTYSTALLFLALNANEPNNTPNNSLEQPNTPATFPSSPSSEPNNLPNPMRNTTPSPNVFDSPSQAPIPNDDSAKTLSASGIDESKFKEDEDIEQAKKMMDLHAIQNSFFDKDRLLQDNHLNILYNAGDTYRIRLRYAMTTTFIFDEDNIIYVSLGDPTGFEVSYPNNEQYALNNVLIIKPLLIGVDSNLTVIGSSGKVYTFYIFSTTFTSKKNPLLSVFVSSNRKIGTIDVGDKNKKKDQASGIKTNTLFTNDSFKKIDYSSKEIDDGKFVKIGDEVNHIYIEKSKISRGYIQKPKSKRTWWSLWLYKRPLKPSKDIQAFEIFDDGKYTYFKFNRDLSVFKFPYPYKVVDKYDSPINSKIVGNYIIAEDVSDKWTLRLGDEYVCVHKLKYEQYIKYLKSNLRTNERLDNKDFLSQIPQVNPKLERQKEVQKIKDYVSKPKISKQIERPTQKTLYKTKKGIKHCPTLCPPIEKKKTIQEKNNPSKTNPLKTKAKQ
ncbi:TrbG/VirB9 family P-type conjugative transfer protein [Helicobacter cetorum]|uniref:TrbG/VirB9 family P-type conjugative transfer protein n=1 Tax=Helicobacter cetorum TaxID=138563 RepID=UPI000CF0633A|nr:TrbG/VirB9 family P-type conjugative transfer protein [Helicobacter cetorum]